MNRLAGFFFLLFVLFSSLLFANEPAVKVDTIAKSKTYDNDGYSIGFYYGHYIHKVDTTGAMSPGIYTINANLYNFGFKWRHSLFEARFGLGIGNITELHMNWIDNHHWPPFTSIKNYVEIDQKLFEFNIQARVFISNKVRFTPYGWLEYSYLSHESTEYPNIAAVHIGIGLRYRVSNIFSVEASAGYAAWDETDLDTYTTVGYYELGIYKTILPGER